MKLLKIASTFGLFVLTASAVAQSAPVEVSEIAQRLRAGEVITIDNRANPEVRSAGKEPVEVLGDFLFVVERFCKPRDGYGNEIEQWTDECPVLGEVVSFDFSRRNRGIVAPR